MVKVLKIEDHPRYSREFPEAVHIDADILALYILATEMQNVPEGIIKEEMRHTLREVVDATKQALVKGDTL
jgi:hypothetical protein